MNKVTITLELTYHQAIAVMDLLTSSESDTKQSQTKLTVQDSLPSKGTKEPVRIVPTAGKKTTMPSFGRNQAQIDAFTNEEQEKFDKKTAEQLLKEEKNKKEQEQVESIKQSSKPKPATTTLPKKPW